MSQTSLKWMIDNKGFLTLGSRDLSKGFYFCEESLRKIGGFKSGQLPTLSMIYNQKIQSLNILMIKVSKFQEIISLSITKLRATLNAEESTAFESQLNALPKKIKELNAEPYLFVFESMLRRRELIDSALTSLASLIQQNYIAYPSYERVAVAISPLARDYSYQIILLLQKVKQPHLAFLQLYFDMHSTVALPEDVLKKFKTLGYSWLIKAYSLVEREVPPFLMSIYAKFYPEQIGKLPRSEQRHQQIQKYVGLILQQKLLEIQQNFGELVKQKGKKGFCFVCTKPADYYCKDTKVNVCGVQCKKEHLQLLPKQSNLHSIYSQQFQRSMQNLFVDNISSRKSPALSLDFLVAIYLFSNYVPQKVLPHSKVMSVPVIFQRIWMLYLSYYSKTGLCCQQIFACCLSQTESPFLRQMAAQYFIVLAQDIRILQIYNTFDKYTDFRLLSFVLHSIEEQHRPILVQNLVKTAFVNFIPNSQHINDFQRPLVRAFNHQKQLTEEVLRQLFGEQYEQKVLLLILRNQTQINKQKLGYLLTHNESVCRKFLQHIVKRKEGAPIDELLRQIFYFLNVRVSDKIYRLFQLLAEVYIPKHPFNELNFFTYAYFVVMMVTEVNNPAIVQKPTEATMIARVQQFSPDLAQNHSYLLREMLARVTGSPFQQNTRGILSFYKDIHLNLQKEIRSEELILMNWQILYESALTGNLQVVSIYRICCMVASQPAICQTFLQLLVDQLNAVNRDPFLVQAISSIIETQPNAAGYLWKPILQQAFSAPSQLSNQYLHLGLIVHSTQQLTDDNFYQFTRQFCSQVPFAQKPQLMLRLIGANINRIGLVSQLLLNNFDKSDNYYQQINVLKNLAAILKMHQEDHLSVILLQMIRTIPILPITESLVLQAFISIDFDELPHSQQFWSAVSQKCLEFASESRVSALQQIMKNSVKCQSYESYLIQKTLNCHRKELISQQILKNLHKLEPYLPDINREVLALFVCEENLQTIAANFQYFATINSAYKLLLSSIKGELAKNIELKDLNLEPILTVIKDMLQNQEIQLILKLDQLPGLLVQLLSITWESSITTLMHYVSLLVWERSQVKQITFIVTNISAISYHLLEIIQSKKMVDSANGDGKKQRVQQIDALVKMLYDLSQTFQRDVQLRIQFKKLIKYNKANLPSLLKTSITLCKIKYKLHKIAEESQQAIFQKLLVEVQNVFERQAQVQSRLKNKQKLSQIQRLSLGEANKDALRYGELLTEQSLDYLRGHNQLSKKQKGTLRRLLLELLVQGFFDEQTCSFKALSGTPLAQQINQIFDLIK